MSCTSSQRIEPFSVHSPVFQKHPDGQWQPTRKILQALFGLMAWSLTFLTTADAHPERSTANDSRPNIVLILADDQSFRDFGFLGNRLVKTPHLDRLASRSARYADGYVPMSVCRPSLATILTGLYPHQHGIHFNHPPPGLAKMRKLSGDDYRHTRALAEHLIQRVPTLPRILSENGYACLQTGKHWEGRFNLAGFTHGMTTGLPSTSDRYGTRPQANGDPVAHGNGDLGLAIGRDTMKPIRNFLEDHAGRRPFLIWYAPFLPHTPHDSSPRHSQPFERTGVPAHLRPYYASILRFDETVGEILDMLEKHNQTSRTLVVFASDNGFRPMPEQPRRQDPRSKLSVHEDGIRTPILLSWKGRIPPGAHQGIVQTIDIVPTCLAAAGLEQLKTQAMQGISLLDSALGQTPLPQRDAFGAIYPNDAQAIGTPAEHVRGRWIRHGQFKLIQPGRVQPVLRAALYDLGRDPREQNNLIDSEEHRILRARLQNRLDAWWTAKDNQAFHAAKGPDRDRP